MSENIISREEHTEFVKRVEAEENRQNHRLQVLEDNIKEINALVLSVEKLATNMELMLKEQEEQGERLQVLENRDGERWRQVVGYVITAVLGLAIGYIFKILLP